MTAGSAALACGAGAFCVQDEDKAPKRETVSKATFIDLIFYLLLWTSDSCVAACF
jgi:hypothetical protein